jgi:hypothetical protein
VAVAVAALLVLGASPAAALAGEPPAGKAKKCKKNQILVKINGKKRCVPINKVLPPPSDVDQELAFVQAAAGLNLSDGRRLSPAAAKAGRRMLLKAVPDALALLNRLRAVAPRSGAARRTGCSGLPPPPASATTTSNGTDVGVSIGPRGAEVNLEGNRDGVTYRFTYETSELCKIEVPRCPTADGTVEARATPTQRLIIEVFRPGQVLERQVTTMARETKVRGQVADDALLDYIAIHDVARVTVDSLHTRPQRSTVERNVRRFDMRNPNASFLAAAQGASIRINGSRALTFFDTRNFAAYIGDIQREFHVAETGVDGWANFGAHYCPKLVWEPPSGTMTLPKSQPRTFAGRVEASPEAGGGTATGARWEVAEQGNATFSLAAPNAPQVSVDVTVTNAGSQVVATATFKVRSTAGVVREKYEINTEVPPPPGFAGPINGTAVYDSQELGAGNSLDADWFGNLVVTFSPPQFPGEPPTYRLTGGSVNYQYTGRVGDCDVAGAEAFGLATQPDLNESAVLTFFNTTPRTYQLLVPMPVLEQVNGIKSHCDDPNDNGDEFQWFVAAGLPWLVYGPSPGGPVQDDWTITNTGSGNNGAGTPDQTWFWSLMPTP